MKIRIHDIVTRSVSNGPGERTVIWFQGCNRQCPGCANPKTWDINEGKIMSIDEIVKTIPSDLSDVTISGGEPLLQEKQLVELCKELKKRNIGITLFTSYKIAEVSSTLIQYIDILIDGPYIAEQNNKKEELKGSDNQIVHYLTDRYSKQAKLRQGEILIDENGNYLATGFWNKKIRNKLKEV